MKDIRIAIMKKAPADPVNESFSSGLEMPSLTLSNRAKLGINSGIIKTFRGLRLSPCSHRRGRAWRVQYQIATDTFETGRDKSTANRSAKGVRATCPRSEMTMHINGYPGCVTGVIGVARVRTLTAQEPGRVLMVRRFDSHTT